MPSRVPCQNQICVDDAGNEPFCVYPATCFNMNCGKGHTAEKCSNIHSCLDFHCRNRHSKQRQRPCISGAKCRNPQCLFLHPADRVIAPPNGRPRASASRALPQANPPVAKPEARSTSTIVKITGFGPQVTDLGSAGQKLEDALSVLSHHQVIVDIPNRANVSYRNAEAFVHLDSAAAAEAAVRWMNLPANSLGLGPLRAALHSLNAPASGIMRGPQMGNSAGSGRAMQGARQSGRSSSSSRQAPPAADQVGPSGHSAQHQVYMLTVLHLYHESHNQTCSTRHKAAFW